jgi:hypothetical protein
MWSCPENDISFSMQCIAGGKRIIYYGLSSLDMKNGNEEKYAIAAVFHDIGIWTTHTIDYLDPSGLSNSAAWEFSTSANAPKRSFVVVDFY